MAGMEFLAAISALNLAGKVINNLTAADKPEPAATPTTFADAMAKADRSAVASPALQVFLPPDAPALQSVGELQGHQSVSAQQLRFEVRADGSLFAFDGDVQLREIPLSSQSRELLAQTYQQATQ
jgi:hypothetical protein